MASLIRYRRSSDPIRTLPLSQNGIQFCRRRAEARDAGSVWRAVIVVSIAPPFNSRRSPCPIRRSPLQTAHYTCTSFPTIRKPPAWPPLARRVVSVVVVLGMCVVWCLVLVLCLGARRRFFPHMSSLSVTKGRFRFASKWWATASHQS